jgi:TRAP-type C4-dicarboxylate transport system permease small subunit
MATGRSTLELISEAVAQANEFLQAEQRLLRAEIDERVSLAATGIGLIAVAVVLSIAGLLVLLIAAVDGINAAGLPRYWAGLIVGGAVALIALLLAAKAFSDLKSLRRPLRSINQIGSTLKVVKGDAS